MAKSKGFDVKALFLNHGEKFGAAIVGLLALTGLATANWSGCSLLEAELKNIANKTRDAWSSSTNTLPEEKKALFAATPDVERMAQRMASPNEDIEQFTTLRHWNPPINEVREKLAAVVVLAPESPESTLVTFTMIEKEDELESDEDPAVPEKAKEEMSPDEQDLADLFAAKAPGGAAPGGLPGGLPGDSAGLYSGLPGEDSGGAGYSAIPGGGSGPGMPGMPGGMVGMPGMPGGGMELELSGYGGYSGMESGMGMGMGTPVERKVRSCSGVSVRCVFDLYKQTNMVAEALRLAPADVTQRHIDFVNLEIQRKAAVAGLDPWAGEWETLSLKDVAEILDRSAYFDRDIVNPSVVRSEITMPLPSRAAGNWTTANASHKRLENFKLSAEEQDLIDQHQAMLLEEANKLKATLPPEQARSEGFRRYSLASQDLGQALGAQYSNVSESMYSAYQGGPGAGEGPAAGPGTGPGSAGGVRGQAPRFKNKEEMEKFLNATLVANRLLLVRFMDFTCDRGNAYQYRVRLEMRNPNFNVPIDELEQPELATQRTIFSEWSEPTTPIFVPGGYRYYTQKVESKPRTDELAHLNMFYQVDTAGTPVMANLRVPVGVRIGGKQPLEVVDLGKSTLETQEVELKSQDFLAGVTEAPRISSGDFPDLKDFLKSVQGGRAVPDRITVVDSTGAIVNRFAGDKVTGGEKPISESDDMAKVKFVLKQYEKFRPQSADADPSSPYATGSAGGGDSAMMMMMGGGMGEEYMGGGGGRGSSLGNRSGGRRSRKSGSGSSAGPPGGSSVGNPNR
jgi:hypothetical protein